jgi:hypothetical protein
VLQLITDIEPAAKVKAAMNEINAAQRLRLAAYEQSEAEKIRVVKAAEVSTHYVISLGLYDAFLIPKRKLFRNSICTTTSVWIALV